MRDTQGSISREEKREDWFVVIKMSQVLIQNMI